MNESDIVYDLAVIGAGPGGYVAAIRAAQLGLKTVCIESRSSLGGTCLNVGCIPSKALLQSSEAYHQMHATAKENGITFDNLSINIKKMMARKNKIVKILTRGIETLFKKNNINHLNGTASFIDKNTLKVKSSKDDSESIIKANNILIATGSQPIEFPNAPFDGERIISSTEALSLEDVPNELVIVGGGVIGLELGSVWARLGAKITIIEATPTILPNMDKDIIDTMTAVFKKDKFKIHTSAYFKEVVKNSDNLVVIAEKDGEKTEIPCDKLLIAVGRKPYTVGLDLEKVDIKANESGRLDVDENYRTNIPNIYAIGDLIAGPMLAHKAEEEGVSCVEKIAGKAGHVNYETIPGVVYTWPEVAAIGKTEAQCQEKGIEYKIGKFPFMANGRARCGFETRGFVKIVADAKTDKIIGAHMVGPNASELIGEIAIGMEFSASSEDIARSIHAHPTLNEVIKEACLM